MCHPPIIQVQWGQYVVRVFVWHVTNLSCEGVPGVHTFFHFFKRAVVSHWLFSDSRVLSCDRPFTGVHYFTCFAASCSSVSFLIMLSKELREMIVARYQGGIMASEIHRRLSETETRKAVKNFIQLFLKTKQVLPNKNCREEEHGKKSHPEPHICCSTQLHPWPSQEKKPQWVAAPRDPQGRHRLLQEEDRGFADQEAPGRKKWIWFESFAIAPSQTTSRTWFSLMSAISSLASTLTHKMKGATERLSR